MAKKKEILWLSFLVVVLVWFCAGMGLFYTDAGSPRMVESIYGEQVELFGNGVYANNSMLKATTAKGSDLSMLFVSLAVLATSIKRTIGPKIKLLHSGFLVSVLYYSATMAFGVAYSKMFLAYLLLFSAAFFAFVVSMMDLCKSIQPGDKGEKYRGTAVFTMLSGCTALVWLMSILPTLFTDAPLDILSIYTTEPTFLIDIGLILPTCLLGGVLLLKNRPMGYILPPVMFTFLGVIAITVIGQTALQLWYGVVVSVQQVIGYVGTFVLFGAIAVIVNIRFMRKCWPNRA